MDPYRVISSFKSCPLNKSKSKLDRYDLGSVWKFVNDGRNLNGAHNSLVDVKATCDDKYVYQRAGESWAVVREIL
jgi:hypothetical protein